MVVLHPPFSLSSFSLCFIVDPFSIMFHVVFQLTLSVSLLFLSDWTWLPDFLQLRPLAQHLIRLTHPIISYSLPCFMSFIPLPSNHTAVPDTFRTHFAIVVVTLLPIYFPVFQSLVVLAHYLVPLAESFWLIIRIHFLCAFVQFTVLPRQLSTYCRLPPGSSSGSLNFPWLSLAGLNEL